MTDIQLYLAVGLPIIAILTSLTVSILQVSAIRGEVVRIHDDMRALRADLNTLTGKVIEIDNRLTRIEERLEHP